MTRRHPPTLGDALAAAGRSATPRKRPVARPGRRRTRKGGKGDLSDRLAGVLALAGIPYAREQRFHHARKWRFDFVVGRSVLKVAVECDGGIWSGGRHNRGKGYQDDCQKLNEATAMGWVVLRVTAGQIRDGSALAWIERTLTARGGGREG